ncbi:MAG: hypothetical protein M3271_09430, partial [Actinomycetota bacterium]|nr:hypothetical protein [Actinomycetota bacterium]
MTEARAKLVDRAFSDNATGSEKCEAVAEVLGLAEVMGREDDGSAELADEKLGYETPHGAGRDRV